ncbi:MAG: LysM peptidoglycan-binding domain-containing protein [Proteiniphilum sp.]|uniref:LysM peptidoglycan-binding domain-containing protein n=1 Tax=Proteiniphilum sp. TaxID=1926877 RepID=UPI002ABBE094|nr:LysM peptidoglycan-binding domain-containing protein [Proteiniphilum sp.]MDY9918828.1 LysM peptidoglycan-binding domain-containing protein [Proteiniphilum sp.]
MHNRFNLSKIFWTVLFLGISLLSLQAQDLKYKTVEVNGQTYYEYNVQSGEGLYAISRTFSVSVADILRHNPGAERGLQNGQKLLIPVAGENKGQVVSPSQSANVPQSSQSPRPFQSFQSPPADQNTTFQHTVVLGETVYGIAKMYHTTVDEIFRLNPGAREGIAEGQVLTIPQRRVISQEKEENYRYHTILPKETLYSVSKTYSLKPEDVMRANPGLSVETFQIGKTIRIPFFESYEVILPYEEQTTNIIHKVSRGETLYSIAKRYNVEVQEIQRLNPMLEGGLKSNMELLVPVKRILVEDDSRSNANEANRLLTQQIPSERVNVMKVGLLLPFLDETRGSHLRLQEYYEGFLLAVEKMKNNGANIELYVFEIGKGDDTQKLQSLLGTMEMQSLNLIIGGVSDAQIKMLSDFSRSHNMKYVVPFSQSNGEVLNNGNLFQVNPVQHMTYIKTASVFLQTFRNANIIFVQGGANDKNEFISLLQNDLRRNNVRYETLNATTTLSSTILALMSRSKENVIVPTSGDSGLLRQITDELRKVQESDSGFAIRLFGYPDWQAYSNVKEDYSLFNTYIFAPFFANEQSRDVEAFKSNFRKWYGRDLLETFPSYGMWGYDTALFFLTALQRYGNNFEQNIERVNVNSLQFPFHFERPNNWGGFINSGLYFINYSTNGRIIKTDKSQ